MNRKSVLGEMLAVSIIAMTMLSMAVSVAADEEVTSSFDAIRKFPVKSLQPELAPIDDLRALAGTFAFSQGAAFAADWDRLRYDKGGNWTLLVDKRSGLPNVATGSGIPWIPGRGNALSLDDISSYLDGSSMLDTQVLERIARDFMTTYPALFSTSPWDLTLLSDGSGNFGGYLWVVQFQLSRNGLPVENARVVFLVNNGNLVQFGTENVAPISVNTTPSFGANGARVILSNYIGGFQAEDAWVEPGVLSILPVPTTQEGEPYKANIGQGLNYRLIYTLVLARPRVAGEWLARIDAVTGEVLEFKDRNHYSEVSGGVYPAGLGPVEIVRPFPFVSVTNLKDHTTKSTDRGGNYPYDGGTSSAEISSQFVDITDACVNPPGMTRLELPGDLPFGAVPNPSKCQTPAWGGAANTRGSRTSYYYLNMASQKAKGWLPANNWLRTGKVYAMVNYDGCISIGFGNGLYLCNQDSWYPDVITHEFSHCLDDNDGIVGQDQTSCEATANIGTILQKHLSCIDGNYFLRPYPSCSRAGGICTHCLGGRENDWEQLSTRTPSTPAGYIQTNCTVFSGALCEREGHCEAYVISEAVWDLATKELPNMGHDQNTAWNIVDRLWFLSRAASRLAFTCMTDHGTITGSNGCGMGNWFNTFLLADDDDGNLANGTPHGRAIFNAFNAHGIACSSPTMTNHETCVALAVPSVTAAAAPGKVTLTWDAVQNADKYFVYRNEIATSASYILLAGNSPFPTPPISGTTYVDTEVASGVAYYYTVQAVKTILINNQPQDVCFSALAPAVTGTPGGAYTIAGKIVGGGEGISVTAQNISDPFAITASAVTLSGGSYSIRVPSSGSFKLTPWKVGYLFSPADQAVEVSGGNVTAPDFSIRKVSYINGQLAFPTGSGFGGVAIRATSDPGGQIIASTTSEYGTGYYHLPLADGNYIIAPESSDYDFSPENLPVLVQDKDVRQDFVATGKWHVNGHVTCNGKGMKNVSITSSAGSTSTYLDGSYTLHLGDGIYTITPRSTGSIFSPLSRTVVLAGGNYEEFVDFTTEDGQFVVGGKIQSNGMPISGVEIKTGASIAHSGADGRYFLGGVPNGSHVVTAQKDGYAFCPKTITIGCEGLDNQDFLLPFPGDCRGVDGRYDCTISIGEVQKAINMFLGIAVLDCGADCNNNGRVSNGEVMNVINGYLGLPITCPYNRGASLSGGPTITIGSTSSIPGAIVRLPITMSSNGAMVHSVGLDISFVSCLLTLDDVITNGEHDWGLEVASSVTDRGYSLWANEIDDNLLRFGLFNTASDPHLQTSLELPDGVIAHVRFRVNPSASGVAVLSNECDTTDADGNSFDSACGAGAITLPAACSITCTASASSSSGTPPLTVSFSATATPSNCTGTPSFLWSFGDGGTSSLQNANHTYAAAGIFNWTMTATIGCTACTKSGTISVTTGCTLSCTASASPSTGAAPLAVTFSATTTPANCAGTVSYLWDFGDGVTSSAQNPSHTYNALGQYSWVMTASVADQVCTQSGTIDVAPASGVYSIKGEVTSLSPTGPAMQGVLVQIVGTSLEATTGPDGKYHFDGLGAGSYIVRPGILDCKKFTPLRYDVSLPVPGGNSNAENKNFYATDGGFCHPCYVSLDLDLGRCGDYGDRTTCDRNARLIFSRCLHTATAQSNSALYNATLLAISVTRHNGQPVQETAPLTITAEGDYFINIANGDQVNKETMASSAVIDLAPYGQIVKPNEIKQTVPVLVKKVHLLPGDYILSVEVRSNPGSYLTVVVSNVDFSVVL